LKLLKNLANLPLQLLVPDEEAEDALSPSQFRVAGEQDPALGAGHAGQLLIMQIGMVNSIVSQDPQPPGQTPQHSIHQEIQTFLRC
jgi:hypothetical protein